MNLLAPSVPARVVTPPARSIPSAHRRALLPAPKGCGEGGQAFQTLSSVDLASKLSARFAASCPGDLSEFNPQFQ